MTNSWNNYIVVPLCTFFMQKENTPKLNVLSLSSVYCCQLFVLTDVLLMTAQ